MSEYGGTSTVFRVAEDRTFADLRDDTLALHPDARIGVADPSQLDETIRRSWARLFLDYEIAQPFPQL